jgi:DNA-binding IclR family transcriptional regulator
MVGNDSRRSVDRALTLLEAFGESETLGVTQLAGRAALPKSTTHRILVMLEQRGVVERTGNKYRLGIRLFELGNRVPFGASDVREVALPFVCELFEATEQTVHLAVLGESQVVYLMKLRAPACRTAPTRIGARMPAHSTALGKALLAYSSSRKLANLLSMPLRPYTVKTIVIPRMLVEHLKGVRREGIAWDREETQYGLVCVAAPILDPTGRAIAAVSVAGDPRRVDSHAAAVRRTALAIAQCISTGIP